eukprot:GHVU01104105.1.p1 GENE.GHVU01104105.1~~GHVU01104105.1.p1  ORF type:complete len:103 (+),score=1.38 GHVU01104105.1:215-523(+)
MALLLLSSMIAMAVRLSIPGYDDGDDDDNGTVANAPSLFVVHACSQSIQLYVCRSLSTPRYTHSFGIGNIGSDIASVVCVHTPVSSLWRGRTDPCVCSPCSG